MPTLQTVPMRRVQLELPAEQAKYYLALMVAMVAANRMACDSADVSIVWIDA